MMTTPTPKTRRPDWAAHTTGNTTYDLAHLNEYQTTFTTKNGTPFRVRVKFGHHCFTRKTEPTDTPDMLYRASPAGDVRAFDLDRYMLSKHLAQYISGFMDGHCYNTGNGKFFVIRLVTYDGKERDYEIYFRVYRSQNPRGLVLDIRSAFLRDPDRMDSRSHQGKIHFGAILSNVQKGQQPRTTGNRQKI